MATISVFEHTGVGDVITGHQSDAHKPRGAAADFKVGVENRIRERSERKNFVPPTFPNVGCTSKQISVGAC